MNKAVMHSVSPQQCKRIVAGKQTILLSKTRPMLETPFKDYIYCTKSNEMLWVLRKEYRQGIKEIAKIFTAKDVGGAYMGNGKVIGEFVCDYIDEYKYSVANYGGLDIDCQQLDDTCLTKLQVEEYANGKDLYGWHISDLVIYDKPRELGEFRKPCDCEHYQDYASYYGLCQTCENKIIRPFQSWGYVEG